MGKSVGRHGGGAPTSLPRRAGLVTGRPAKLYYGCRLGGAACCRPTAAHPRAPPVAAAAAPTDTSITVMPAVTTTTTTACPCPCAAPATAASVTAASTDTKAKAGVSRATRDAGSRSCVRLPLCVCGSPCEGRCNRLPARPCRRMRYCRCLVTPCGPTGCLRQRQLRRTVSAPPCRTKLRKKTQSDHSFSMQSALTP